jgi:hypothetical protein
MLSQAMKGLKPLQMIGELNVGERMLGAEKPHKAHINEIKSKRN